MQALNAFLAQQLRRKRQEKGWSLDKAAEHTGVSKAMLGQIERGESSPTLATLWKIADGFEASLSSFLEPTLQSAATQEVRNADQLRQQPASDPMLVAPLFPFDPALKFEMYEMTIPPDYERLSEPHAPGVVEHVIVIEGQMELLVDWNWQGLGKGDALAFAADRHHGYRNVGPKTAVFHNLIHYPQS